MKSETSPLSAVIREIAATGARRARRNRSSKQNQLALWIGRIVIAFNQLEYRLAEQLAEELGHVSGPVRDTIHASMTFGQRLDMLSALLLERFRENPGHLASVNEIIDALSAAENCRNNVVHSEWSMALVFCMEFERRKVRTKGRKGLKIQTARANVVGLKEAVRSIELLSTLAPALIGNPQAAAKYRTEFFVRFKKNLDQAFRPPLRTENQSESTALAFFAGRNAG